MTSLQHLWQRVNTVWGRMAAGAAVAVLAAALAPAAWGLLVRAVVGWVGFAGTALLLIGLAMRLADAEDIRRVAASDDLPRTVALAFVLTAAAVSVVAVVGLLGDAKQMPAGFVRSLHLVLGLAAVLLSWLLVHAVFTLRYAHTYYSADDTGEDAGGLVFPPPAPDEPNYLDFAYYSYVVGMTAQTADIGVSSRAMRLTTLIHGLVAFLFNTAIVALTIGAVGGLLQ